MKNASVVAQRITHEGIMKKCGVLKIDANQEMRKYAHLSTGEYKGAIEKERSPQIEGEKRCAEKTRLDTELKQPITAKEKSVENLNSAFHTMKQISIYWRKNYVPHRLNGFCGSS